MKSYWITVGPNLIIGVLMKGGKFEHRCTMKGGNYVKTQR
jgi:hypothetical protein